MDLPALHFHYQPHRFSPETLRRMDDLLAHLPVKVEVLPILGLVLMVPALHGAQLLGILAGQGK